LKAGTGIAELIALEISKQVYSFFVFIFINTIHFYEVSKYYFVGQTKAPVEETRKKIWLVDSKVNKNEIFFFSFSTLFFFHSFSWQVCSVPGTYC